MRNPNEGSDASGMTLEQAMKEGAGTQSLAKDFAPPEHILQFFAWAHLPQHLQAVSRPFGELAHELMALPRNPERTVALRKLLEAKDAAVRAALAK